MRHLLVATCALLLVTGACASVSLEQREQVMKELGVTNCAQIGYDLTPLSGADYVGADPSYHYLLHFCGPTFESVCASNGGSLCQYNSATPPVFSHVLARWDASGVWSQCTDAFNCPQGGVQVRFQNGDKCGGSGPARQVTVQVPCSTSTSHSYTIVSSGCMYTVVMPSPAGCAASPAATCNVTLAGHNYDLVPLADTWGLNFTDSQYTYMWNPCGTVLVYSECAQAGGSLCQYSSTQGFVAVLATTQGLPAPQWSMLDPTNPAAGVSVTYKNGATCYSRGQTLPRVVQIDFVCAPNNPNLNTYTLQETSPCSYHITMNTALACPTSA